MRAMIPDKALVLLVKKRRISRWIERAGERIYRPTLEERETARRLLKDMPALFPDLLYQSGLCLIYLYEQGEMERDAVCWTDVTKDCGTLYAIGIARWALEYPAHFQLLFLHELAHVAVGGEHDKAFCDCLDRMIAKFNCATGASLVNDYGSGGKRTVSR